MATTLTRNLKLRLNSNLTADSKYNLTRLDLLGSTFLTDSTNTLSIRSQTDINIEPNSPDIGGSGIGGTINLGTASHPLTALEIHAASIVLDGPVSLTDQATSGTKSLLLEYKSDVVGAVDTVADRTLAIDVDGANRNLVLGADLSVTGATSVAFIATAATAVTLPNTGTLVSLAGTEVLTNKTIVASSNTITGLTNASIDPSAGIVYSKLLLSASVTNSDIASGAGISYSKLSLGSSIVDADISSSAAISYTKLVLTGSVSNSDISASAAIAYSKLNLASGIVNSDVSASAAIAGSKISPDFGNQIVRTTNKLEVAKGGFSTTIEAATGLAANTVLLLPIDNGINGQILKTDGSGQLGWVTAVGSGTVTSIDLAAPAEFTVSGNPVTTSGTLTLSKANQAANQVWSGPVSGAAAQPGFRSLVLADLPALTKSDVGLGNVDNTSDVNKPVSTAQATADGVVQAFDIQRANHTGTQAVGTITGLAAVATSGLKADVGLGNVDNTSDATKDAAVATLTNKTLSAATNVITGLTNTSIDAAAAIAVSKLAAGTNTYVLTTTAGVPVWAAPVPTVLSASATWLTADGTTKVVTHSLGTLNVLVQIYDIATGTTLQIDSVTRTDTNTITLVASQAPGVSWKILILAI